MTIGSQLPELDWGAFLPHRPYKIGSQNTPYKLELKVITLVDKNDSQRNQQLCTFNICHGKSISLFSFRRGICQETPFEHCF